jgi:hypothetical protein
MVKVEKQDVSVRAVSVDEARKSLGRLAREAYDYGTVTILTRYGCDIAVIMPVAWLEQAA